MASISLSSAIKTNLLTLQATNDLLDRTQNRLSTGKRVNSAIDDAVSFFQSKTLTDRSVDFNDRKSQIDQAISSVKAATSGIEAADRIVKQLKGIISTAKSATAKERADLRKQFNTLGAQLTQLVQDTSYQGLNLTNSTATKLTVNFSNRSAAKLDITGRNLLASKLITGTAAALGSLIATQVVTRSWSAALATLAPLASQYDKGLAVLDGAVTTLRSAASSLGANVTFLATRLDFTKQYVKTLDEGSGKLVLADINEEGANLVSLQTRQQLSLQALSFAAQSERAVLSLFR